MPVRSTKNQYPGVNAHLHSIWQSRGGWDAFHNVHTFNLAEQLRQALILSDFANYSVQIESSIQNRRGDSPRETRTFRAVTVYRKNPGVREKPIVWLELLAPPTKDHFYNLQSYMGKRLLRVNRQAVFVELDYLNAYRPTFQALPIAYAYRIIVVDPFPDLSRGESIVYQFTTDEAIPTVRIPLVGDDVLYFDLNTVYHKTFEETLCGIEFVDYTRFPNDFRYYSILDQSRIACRMLAVLKAAQEGVDLENSPFPAPVLPLSKALKEIEKLTAIK